MSEMTSWVTIPLRKKIRAQFEPRYKRALTEQEVEDIAENLTGYMEAILKFKATAIRHKS